VRGRKKEGDSSLGKGRDLKEEKGDNSGEGKNGTVMHHARGF